MQCEAFAPGEQVRALIAQARKDVERGHPSEAAQRLRESASALARNGDQEGACALLGAALEASPSDPQHWFNYAVTLRRLGRIDEAAEALDRLLKLDPPNLSALLEKGEVEELRCRPRAAAMHYRAALQTLPPGYRAPAWFEPKLRRAREAVEESNRALESFVADGLADIRARFADAPLGRFERCVDTVLQKRRVWRQQPTFMYFPELPAIEFYDRRDFPWLDGIEAAADDIRGELLDVLADGSGTLDPYVDMPGKPAEQWRALNRSRRWGVYSLWREGKAYPEHIARCPRTVAALDDCPRWDVPGNGPTALFSILDARTRIPAHTGPVNTRLVVHLPLIVPPGCGFRVGGQEREWRPGEAFVFDDSINHEAWNDSDLPRAVLIFDVWSPFLSAAERELMRALTARIGEYYGSFSNSGGI
jgi:aspartyl/asparaginyl beta-hydroxylase (cupin superfamily)